MSLRPRDRNPLVWAWRCAWAATIDDNPSSTISGMHKHLDHVTHWQITHHLVYLKVLVILPDKINAGCLSMTIESIKWGLVAAVIWLGIYLFTTVVLGVSVF